MALHKLVEYTVFDNTALEDVQMSIKHIQAVTRAYRGKPIVLAPNDKEPIWYWFVVFFELYKYNPEIIVRIDDESLVLLHTVYGKEYARNEKVMLAPPLYSTPDSGMAFVPEHRINLSTANQITVDSITSNTLLLPEVQAEHLIFQGSNTSASDLMTLRLWLSLGARISYQHGNQFISIVD